MYDRKRCAQCAPQSPARNACGCARTCGCGAGNMSVRAECVGASDYDTPVMAYVPWQEWGEVYDEVEALCVGTLFRSLNKPLLGKRGCVK